jgi:ABC-2 type transport system ATP-binding protein
MSENNIIETFDLTKIYHLKGKKKHIKALDKVNIKVKEGEKLGLLGPNGAGKTTMVSILTTLIQPTSGYAIIDGDNILKKTNKVKRKVGLMLGSDMIYYRITGYANLKFFCKIYGIPNYKEKIYNIAKEFELENWLNEYVENYSTGMKVKLSLCRSFLINPKILFLDEPALGLDIKTTNFIIEKLKNLDNTIFLTSHNMHVVEKLCGRVAFIDNGRIKKIGSKGELKKLLQKGIKIKIDINENVNKLMEELEQMEYILETIKTESGLILFLKERIYYNYLFSLLRNYPVRKFQEIDISVEELFLKII